MTTEPIRHKSFFIVEPEGVTGWKPFQLVLTGFTDGPLPIEGLKELLPEALEQGGLRVEAMIINVGAAPWTVNADGGEDG